MASVRTSLAISFVEKYSALVLQTVGSLIVARLVTPKSFGVYGIAFAIVGFAHVIREFGVNAYLVQKPELAPRHVSAALAATCMVAWGLGLLLFAGLPVVSALYGHAVRDATAILLLNFLFMPVSSTIFAILQREMRFGALLRINLSGVATNTVIGIVLSLRGWGADGLAWAYVAGQVVIIVMAALHHPHAEHFRPSFAGVGEVFGFGSPIMLSSLLQQCSTSVANLITARFVTLEAIGLLDRSNTVTSLFSRLFLDVVQPLALPVLSDLRRAGQRLEPVYLNALALMSAVTWPFFMFLALEADPILLFLFGRQWAGAAQLLRLMSLGGVFWIFQPVSNALLISLGQPKRSLRVQMVNQAISLGSVLAAAPMGVQAVAAAGIFVGACHTVLWIAQLRRTIELPLRGLFAMAARSAAVTLMAVAPLLAASLATHGLPVLPQLLLDGLALGAGWLAGVFLLRHPIAGEVKTAVRSLGATAALLQARWAARAS